MIVTRENFPEALCKLKNATEISFDTETTGLNPYHDDKIFSIALATNDESYYFNFKDYADIPDSGILKNHHLHLLDTFIFKDPTKTFFAHNAKFDLHMLSQSGMSILGDVHCTQAVERILRPHEFKYSLEVCAERIGLKKDDEVENHIHENGLWEWEDIPGKKQRNKKKFFDRIPFRIISKYAKQDARICYDLAQYQKKTIAKIDEGKVGTPSLGAVYENENRLIKTVFKMEKVGVQIDRTYCERAKDYELSRVQGALVRFKSETGFDFRDSRKLYQQIFSDEESSWVYTDKGNPSFDSATLKLFKNPLAKTILEYRDAKSKSDYYHGFLYHADSLGVVHPNFNQDRTKTGRFSSSEPNFQNLTNEEDEELAQEFVVRRAIIPRPGYILVMPDWSMMEYRLLFEYIYRGMGEITPFGKMIACGADVHQATADSVTQAGFPLKRSTAKNGNFAILYGAGYETLANTIGSSIQEAKRLKSAIFRNSPEMSRFIDTVIYTAKTRGWIRNWLGRRYYCSDANFAYKFPNYLIQGGCADVIKVAMNQIDDYLKDKKSRMIMTVHDEILAEVHESEIDEVPKRIKEIMENVFPSEYIPLTVSMEWSAISLADKVKGFPS